MNASRWESNLIELIARASSSLPRDVETALRRARAAEAPGSSARSAFEVLLDNVEMARRDRRPLCQDTGTIMLWVEAPATVRQAPFRKIFENAVAAATAEGLLRQNCVDPLTGRNTGNNLGRGHPVIHWRERDGQAVTVRLALKGGGSENVSTQYALPDAGLEAGRDLEGVRRCLLDAVYRAQGKGCAPGILAAIVGGDRSSAYAASKELLLRRIGERSPIPELADLEQRVLEESNRLGIGPMGFGGATTLLEVFLDSRHRLPASYFVTVSYMCWAFRRQGFVATPTGECLDWLY